MKRIISLILVLVSLALLPSCSLFTEEQVITVYNAAEHYTIDRIVLATSPDVLNADDAVDLLEETEYMGVSSGFDYTVEVPTKSIGKTWYVFVSGALEGYTETYNIMGMYTAEAEIGTLFDGLTYGIKIDFDTEANTFVITPLNEI